MTQEKYILIVDDESGIREIVTRALEGRRTETAATADEARQKFSAASMALLDLKLFDDDGMELLKEFKAAVPSTPIIVMTAFATIEKAVEAMKLGASDFLTKPFASLDQLRLVVDRALREAALVDENQRLKGLLIEQDRFEEMIGGSDTMKKVYNLVARAAAGDSTVLITGESGTGKELVARALHRRSARSGRPFVEINCAAIPENLLESELFGYEKGAFTGAYRQKKGLFETAAGGTIFLDEIGELPQSLQVKLLRVIEEKSFTRLGGTALTKVDARMIAATNKNLAESVNEGRFREDLYYRLAVITIDLPPLHERRGDVELLLSAWLPDVPFEKEAWEFLVNHRWPGNIRELKNFVERVKQLGVGRVGLDDLPFSNLSRQGAVDITGNLPEMVDAYERAIIEKAMKDCGGSRIDAAKLLGVTRQSLQYKLEKYGI